MQFFKMVPLFLGLAAAIATAQVPKVEGVVELPIKGMSAVESNGQINFISENGRFVITGQIYDVLARKPLDTLAQMRAASTRIDFKEIGVDVDALNTISMGQGSKEVVLFVDPRSEISLRLIDEAEKLTDKYTFKIVLIPALGEESHRQAKALHCAEDRSEALTALKNGKMGTLPQKPHCDPSQYDQTLLLVHFMGIGAVPYLVAPDGRFNQGRPAQLASWLENVK